jgi:hypothetical protein
MERTEIRAAVSWTARRADSQSRPPVVPSPGCLRRADSEPQRLHLSIAGRQTRTRSVSDPVADGRAGDEHLRAMPVRAGSGLVRNVALPLVPAAWMGNPAVERRRLFGCAAPDHRAARPAAGNDVRPVRSSRRSPCIGLRKDRVAPVAIRRWACVHRRGAMRGRLHAGRFGASHRAWLLFCELRNLSRFADFLRWRWKNSFPG